MAAGGGHLEGALGALLPLDVLQINERSAGLAHFWLRTGEHLRAAEMVGELNQRCSRDDLHFGARPGGFGAAGGGTDETFATSVGADRGRQHPRHRGDGAVEAEFTQHGEPGKRVRRNGADRPHQTECNRQIVVAAFLR